MDGQDFEEIEKYGVLRWLGELAQALKTEKYQPEPIRRVFIPKANGKLRPLGISTLRDRVCMTAAMLVLEPMAQVTAATNAGENAMAVQKKILAKCGEKFPRSPSDPSSRLQNIIKCGNDEGMKDLRLDQCDELSYLPY